MEQSQYMISWQKWLDPLSVAYNSFKRNRQEDDFEQSDFSDLSEYSGPVAQTAHGVIPINESNLPSTVFNLWRADLNFNMTRNVEIIINNTLGIESYDLISPLRFRVAIGKLFDEKDVQERLTKAIIEYKVSREPKQEPEALEQNSAYFSLLHKQFKHFVVVLAGTKKVVIHGSSDDDVQKKLALYLKNNPESRVQYVSATKTTN